MKDNNTNKKTVSLTKYIITSVIIAILAIGGTVFVYESKGKAQTASTQDNLDNIADLATLIQQGYIKDVDSKKLYEGAMKGMVAAIDDPYSTYFTAEEAKGFEEDINGNFEGIGAVMSMTNDLPTVAEPPIKDSPAEKAKLQTGDTILKVDDKSIEGKSLSDVVKLVRGEKGTDVKLEIKRGTETFPVTITRDVIPVESVTGKIDEKNKDIGYISISSFSSSTSEEFDKVVTQLRKEGAKSFVLDVRGNPGGMLDQVEKISSRFLKDGQTIVKFESKLEDDEEHKASKKLDGGDKITEPTVLLVDENSASASEILAGAFIDSANIDVVGTKTFGKGTVQTVIPMNDGAEIKLTIKKWLTPSGKWINKKGVEPTIKVEKPSYIQHKLIDTSLTYQLGSINENVKIINEYLKILGYDVDDSDTYNEKTEQAVKSFQEKNKLEVTGTADEKTVRELEKQIVDYWKNHDVQYEKAIETLKKD
ncbi:S41 family peptidase [Vagococcus luciliae]|uniref:Carboxy-terminal processing protease CtpA n=1 Tax=Vagococcus luciliae TaxID=2920380 RepID=A0ABY5P0Q8_9ENTE|nr:S41 family peptidase [Vagococcus luciliae]UUV99261.1 Carboxy-terminal processing protease CtpA [Vagococcus luciliae]